MSVPSYAQAAFDHPLQESQYGHHHGLGIDSDGDQSSIPDVSTTFAHSDTDDSESSSSAFIRSRRALVTSFKSKMAFRDRQLAPLPEYANVPSPTSSAHSRSNSLSDMERTGPGLPRAESIYSLSRVSFASRLAQLTSIPLPTASALSARISAQPTAHLAARSLADAGEQIKLWTRKATDVFQDLDAQDDIEWSAAGGRDGVEAVDQAITRFEALVKVYIIAMEELQMRNDIQTLSDQTLTTHVTQMESVVTEWQKIKTALKNVREQVDLALEWEELWNTSLGQVAQELNALGDLIFEMEEKRHTAGLVDKTPTGKSADRHDFSSADENSPKASRRTATRQLGQKPVSTSPRHDTEKEDSKLLGLFARMQPARASLDFLPMRLSAFNNRARSMFPTGCEELESRRQQLETQWTKLKSDADALRAELGEDKWLLVFRNAASQAYQMFDSVERTCHKLHRAYVSGIAKTDHQTFVRLIGSYEAKRTHYMPAIERVMGLIDQGIADRLSINGEILRLQTELKRRSGDLQSTMDELDQIAASGGQDSMSSQLRDSISTIVSSEQSHATSAFDTPHSSPASSVMWSRNDSVSGLVTPLASNKLPRQRRLSNVGSSTPSTRSRLSDAKRLVTAPAAHEPYQDKKTNPFREFKQPINKPRWSSSGNAAMTRDFLPLSATEPSPYSKSLATPRKYTPSRQSQVQSSLGADRRAMSPSPAMTGTPLLNRRLSYNTLPPRAASAMEHRSASSSSLMSPVRGRTPSSSRLVTPSTPSTLRKQSNPSTLPTLVDEESPSQPPSSIPRLVSRQSSNLLPTDGDRRSTINNVGGSGIPAASGRRSSLAHSAFMATMSPAARRTTSLFVPAGAGAKATGRDSRLSMGRAASAMGSSVNGSETAEKPRWR